MLYVICVMVVNTKNTRKKGRPKGGSQTHILQMRTNEEFLNTVDEWRRKQADIPGRSEAIRRLVELAAAHAKKAKE